MNDELANRIWIVVALAATVIAVGLSGRAGAPLLGGDSRAYIAAAEGLLDGAGLGGVPGAYPGFVILLSVVLWVDASLWVLVAVQIAATIAAGYCVFRLARELGGSVAGLVASVLFMLNPDVLRWTGYVLTDSLFISSVPIAVWSVWRARAGSPRARFAAVVVVIVTASIRPTGWLILPILGCFLMWPRQGSLPRRSALMGAVVLTSVLLLSFTVNPAQRLNAADPTYKLSHGVVIPGYPEGWLSMPDASGRQEGLRASIDYALEHPLSVIRLGFVRVATEFGLVRPFYGVTHNLFLIVWGGATYLLFLLGVWKARRGPLLGVVLATIGALVAFVALSFASYDGRFALYPMSLISVIAGCAFSARRHPVAHRSSP